MASTDHSFRPHEKSAEHPHDSEGIDADVAGIPGRDTLTRQLDNVRGGDALPSSVRDPMAETLGDPLTDVRVHSDARAASLVRSLGAQGFTYGRNIYVDGKASDDLLAHEAAHAAQHRGAAPRGPVTLGGSAEHEEYADRAAANRYVKLPVSVPTAAPRVRFKGGGDGDTRSFIANQITSESKAAEFLKKATSEGRAMIESIVREKFKDKAEELIKNNPAAGGPAPKPAGADKAKAESANKKGQAKDKKSGKEAAKDPKTNVPGGDKTKAVVAAKVAAGPASANDVGEFKGVSSSELGLIHQELIEHEEWKAAKGKVGDAGSAERALFVADKTGAGMVGGFAEGAATGFVATGVTKLVEFGAMKVAGSEVPGIGPIIAGAMSGYALYKKNWKESAEKFKAFGKGSDDYEILANSLGAVSEAIDIAVNVLNVIAGIVAAIGLVMWIVTLCTLGAAAPLAVLLTEIAAGIVTATLIMDALNKLCIQPMILLMRAMHTFKSEADPRDVQEQGDQIQETASSVSGFIGNIAGGKAAEKGMSAAGVGGPHETADGTEGHKGGETRPAETKGGEGHETKTAEAEAKPTEPKVETHEPKVEAKEPTAEKTPGEPEGERKAGEPEGETKEAAKGEKDTKPESKTEDAKAKKAQAEKKLEEAETEKKAAEKAAEDKYKENKAARKKALEEHEDAANKREAAHEKELDRIEGERKAAIEKARAEAEAKTKANKEAAATQDEKLAEAKGEQKAAHEEAAAKRAAEVKAAESTREAETSHAKEKLDAAKAANKAHAEAEANPKALEGKAQAIEDGHSAAMDKISQIEDPAMREQAAQSEAEKYKQDKADLRQEQADARRAAAEKQAQADAKAKADYAKEVADADAKRDAATSKAKDAELASNDRTNNEFEKTKAQVEAEKARLAEATKSAKEAEAGAKDQANAAAEQEKFEADVNNKAGKQAEDAKLDAEKAKIKEEGREAMERQEKANKAATKAEEEAAEAKKGADRDNPAKRAAGWIKDHVLDPILEPFSVKKNFEKAHKDIDLMPVKDQYKEAQKKEKDKAKEQDEKALKPNDEGVEQHEEKKAKQDETKADETKAKDKADEQKEGDHAAKAPVKPEPKKEEKKLTEDEEKEREKAGKKVSPKYAEPPGTEEQIETLKGKIIDNLNARQLWEKAQRDMAIKKAKAEGDTKQVAELEKAAKEGTESSKEHGAATARKDAAVKAQQQRQEDGQAKLMDGTNRMVGIGVLEASLWGFEKFTGLAEKLPGSAGAKFHAMHEDAVKFQGAIKNMKKMLEQKKAEGAKNKAGIDKDHAAVSATKAKSGTNTAAMAKNEKSAGDLKHKTETTAKSAADEEAKAKAGAAKTGGEAKAGQDEYKSLVGNMTGWAVGHRQARLDAQAQGRELEEKEKREAAERRKRWAEEAAKGMAAGADNPYGAPMM
jgi:hypothetical protein